MNFARLFFCRLFKIKSRAIWREYAFTITASPANCLCKWHCSRSRFESNRARVFFLVINIRVLLTRDYRPRVSFVSLPLAFFYPSVPPKCADDTLIWHDGDKKWRLSWIGSFEKLPIVPRKAERPGFSGVRLGHISAFSGFSVPLRNALRKYALCVGRLTSAKIIERLMRVPPDAFVTIAIIVMLALYIDIINAFLWLHERIGREKHSFYAIDIICDEQMFI